MKILTEQQLNLIEKLSIDTAELSMLCIAACSELPPEQVLSLIENEEHVTMSVQGLDMVKMILGFDDRVVNKKLMKSYCASRDFYLQWASNLKAMNYRATKP